MTASNSSPFAPWIVEGRPKKQRSGAASEYGDRQAERRQREEAGRGTILTPPAPRLDPARVVQRQSARLRPQLSLRGRACRQLEPVSSAMLLSGRSGPRVPIVGRRLIEIRGGFFEPGLRT
jgi:hypothetical protein